MKLPAVIFISFLATAADAWKVGDKATGETDPNVTTKYSRWANNISSGDSCEALENSFNIDFLQLHEWNPSLLKDPCNPIEGWSYCVDSSSTTNSLASNMGTKAPTLEDPASTTSDSTTASQPVTTTATTGSSHVSSTTAATTASNAMPTSGSTTTTASISAQQAGGAVSIAPASIAGSVMLLGFWSLLVDVQSLSFLC